MSFNEFRKQIKALGREVNIDTVTKTRALIAPMLEIAPFEGVVIQRDVYYGNDERHRLDIFTSTAGGNKPLLIFIHGGGFIAGDKYTPDTPFYDNIGVWAVRNGFSAVNMTYRLAPLYQWPAGVEDIHRAVKWIKTNAEQYGLDASQTFLMGQSAGAAHAAAYIAHPEVYAPDQHCLSGVILVSGLYNFASMQTSDLERAYLGNDESLYAERSSLNGLVASDIALLVTVSEYDPFFLEAQALELLTALQKQYNKLPRFVYMMGQNHLSNVLYLGLEGDLLAPQLKQFIEDYK